MDHTSELTISKTEHKPLHDTHHRLLLPLLLLGDAAALTAAFVLAYHLRFQQLPYFAEYSPRHYLTLVAVVIPAWLLLFAAFHL